jgi:uncharacterized protein
MLLITDPIHKLIELNDLEHDIIDTPLFQRLRWVSQLSGAQLVYPDANHSRFSHSLGAMHISSLYAEHIFHGNECTIQHIKISALLHDIGHGPFSHVFDEAVYKDIYPLVEKGHDRHRIYLLEYFNDIFIKYHISKDYITDIWLGIFPIEKQIVQGHLGADRLDYLLRDSYHSGIDLSFSLLRIIKLSSIQSGGLNGQILTYHPKLDQEIKMILATRDQMYKKLYQHKKSSSVFNILMKMIISCKDELKLVERTANIDKFILLNDTIVLGEIMNLPNHNDIIHPAKELALKLFYRTKL